MFDDPNSHENRRQLFDVHLVQWESDGRALFELDGSTYLGSFQAPAHWEIGTVGALTLNTAGEVTDFYAYADQRLRRAADLDRAQLNSWGWVLEGHSLLIRAGVILGAFGCVIRDECEILALPPLSTPSVFRATL